MICKLVDFGLWFTYAFFQKGLDETHTYVKYVIHVNGPGRFFTWLFLAEGLHEQHAYVKPPRLAVIILKGDKCFTWTLCDATLCTQDGETLYRGPASKRDARQRL